MAQHTLHPEWIAMHRRRRQLAASLLNALGDKKCVLVTSAEHGAGRTTLLNDLRSHFEHLAPGKVRIASLSVVADDPARHVLPEHLLLIDGPPVQDGTAILVISQAWLAQIDGSLLVVNARQTMRDELNAATHWLREAGIVPLGIVWNEKGLPSVGARLFQRTQRVNRWIPAWLNKWLSGVSL